MEQVERQTGQTPPELAAMPCLPECAAHVWQIFNQLSGTRQNGMTVNPISYSDINAWSMLHKTPLLGWEIEALTGIDAVFIASIHEENKPEKPTA